MKPVMIIHPTCATSYTVVKKLYERGLLGRLVLVDSSRPGPAGILRSGVWSVPWLILDGKPAATDPVEPGEIEAILEGGWSPRGGDPAEAFAETVLHSAYAAAVAYLHGGFEPVLDEDLVSAAVRAPLAGLDPQVLVEELRPRLPELWSRWEDPVMRALGISFVREMWWATRGSLGRETLRGLAEPATVAAWLIAKASIGRSGLPPKPLPDQERIERLANFIQRGAAGLLSRIRREQETILNDDEYWKILEEHVAPRP